VHGQGEWLVSFLTLLEKGTKKAPLLSPSRERKGSPAGRGGEREGGCVSFIIKQKKDAFDLSLSLSRKGTSSTYREVKGGGGLRRGERGEVTAAHRAGKEGWGFYIPRKGGGFPSRRRLYPKRKRDRLCTS